VAALKPLFFLLYLVCFSLQAQIYFARTFGGILEDGGYGLTATPSGLLVAAGYTGSFGAGGSDGFLLGVNGLGFWQWQKTYGGADADVLRDIVWQGQRGYAVGYSKSFPDGRYRGWLLCLNEDGDTLYTRSYTAPGWMLLHGIAADSDGLYLAGLMHDAQGIARGCVLHTDSAGQIIWSYYQDATGFGVSEYLDICLFGDTLLALAGYVVLPDDDQQALITFIRKNSGQLLRNEVIGLPAYDEKATGISFENQRAWFCGAVEDIMNSRSSALLGYINPFSPGHFAEPYFFQLQYNNVFNKIISLGFYDLVISGNSEFIGLGFKSATLFRYKSGFLQWGTNAGTEGYNNAESIVLGTDASIWVVGEHTGIGPGTRAMLLWHLDSTGFFVNPVTVNLSEVTPSQSQIRVSPEGLHVVCNFLDNHPVFLEVMDLSGRRVVIEVLKGENEIVIPVQGLPKVGIIRLNGRYQSQSFRYLWPF